MKKMLELEIPNGIAIEIRGNEIETKGGLGSNKRRFNDALLKISKSGNKIVIEPVGDKGLAKKAAKTERTIKKELSNDINGVNKYFEKRMKVVFAHFPATVEVKGDKVYINKLIGERFPRVANIIGSTKVEAKGQSVRVYGTSLDDVGQTAANIRKACRIRNKDSRVFQDGVYYEVE